MAFTGEERDRVNKALANPKYVWRTIDGIAEETHLEPDVVTAIIVSMKDDVIKSSVPSTDGKDLYASRPRYLEEGKLSDKLRGAFINRLA